MIRFGHIVRMMKSFLAEVKGLGGVTHNRFVSPKGLYSKPKSENAVVINLSESVNQDIILAIQKDVELEDGDVILTDDKNYIHFKLNDGFIEIQGDTVLRDDVKVFGKLHVVGDITTDGNMDAAKSISAGIQVSAPMIAGATDVTTAGISGKAHVHMQNDGNANGGGVVTNAPQ